MVIAPTHRVWEPLPHLLQMPALQDHSPRALSVMTHTMPSHDRGRLARSRRVGPATFGRLVREHGAAGAARAAWMACCAARATTARWRCV